MDRLPLRDPDAKPVENRALGMNGHVKLIRFGEDFEAWPDIRKIEYLKKLASAMNQAAAGMQDERNEIRERLAVTIKQCENADKALQIQKTIVANHITTSNEATNNSAKEIQRLQGEIRSRDHTIATLEAKV